MKVLFLAWRDVTNPAAGGSEVLVDRLARGLVEQGHEAALLCAGPVGQHSYRVVDSGGPISQYARAPLAYLRSFRACDLVVDVANGMPFFAPLWRRRPSMCLVNHVHTPMWSEWFSPPVAAVGRTIERDIMPWMYRNRMFMAVSESTADDLQRIGVHRAQIRVVPNGVDVMQRPRHPRSPEPLFLSVGRLVPHKRIDLLLKLWRRVRPSTGGKLIIVGTGPARERLEAMAGEGVEFQGHVSEEDKHRLMSEAWLLMHPAHVEGWGLVVMEAAQMRTPTLAFAVPGLRDSVANGVSGVLVTSEEEYIKQWIDLTFNTFRRAELSAGAQRRAAQFSWSTTVDLFVGAAEEAVAMGSAPRRRWTSAPSPSPAARAVMTPTDRPIIDLRLADDDQTVAMNETIDIDDERVAQG